MTFGHCEVPLFVPSVLSTPQAPHESRIFHTGTPAKVSLRERDPHTELEEPERWNFRNCFTTKRDTHRRKAANFIFTYFFFCGENLSKFPHENIHGETSVLEISKKKTKSSHFQEGKKKEFWNRHILRRKKTGFEIAEICGGFGQIRSFLLLKCVYEGRANPKPLTPKEDNWTDRHLKYYIYRLEWLEHELNYFQLGRNFQKKLIPLCRNFQKHIQAASHLWTRDLPDQIR